MHSAEVELLDLHMKLDTDSNDTLTIQIYHA